MGTAVEQAGGRIDKFIGDGVMALFGIEQGIEQGSRNALEAARRMAQSLDELNRSLAHDLPEPLRIGIRSEEHTSELQSLMRISYAVFCLKKKKNIKTSLAP